MQPGVKWSKINTDLKPEKVIIVAAGPSLDGFNFESLRGQGYIIAVNDAAKYVPFADAWFTLDPWGLGGKQLPDLSFKGELFAAVPEDFSMPNARIRDHQQICPRPIHYLHRIIFHTISNLEPEMYSNWGLNEDPSCINTLNSGYGAFGIAYHYKPKKILLLGVDATSGYFYNRSVATRSLNHLPLIFRSTLSQIAKAGIEVINGSLNSKVDCFPRLTPANALMNF